jgi:hypothetical protein
MINRLPLSLSMTKNYLTKSFSLTNRLTNSKVKLTELILSSPTSNRKWMRWFLWMKAWKLKLPRWLKPRKLNRSIETSKSQSYMHKSFPWMKVLRESNHRIKNCKPNCHSNTSSLTLPPRPCNSSAMKSRASMRLSSIMLNRLETHSGLTRKN